MFDGALSPWHLLVVAFVVFLLYGPKKIAEHSKALGEAFHRFAEGDESRNGDDAKADAPSVASATHPRGRAYRFGQRLRRRKARS